MNIAELRNKLAYFEKSARESYIEQRHNRDFSKERSWMNGYYAGKTETYDLMAVRLGNLIDWLDREMNKDATDKE